MSLALLPVGRALEPLYARSWPEKGEEKVNVLCEGPSIQRLEREDLLPGPVVAINHAISLSSKLPIDCWATVDDPKKLWRWSKRYRPRELKLFTTENNLGFWAKLLGEGGFNKKMYAWVPTYMEHLATPTEKAPVIPTVITVLSWLASLKDTKHVRLYGCDMRGSESPLSPGGFSEEEDIGWQYRWAIERHFISLMTKKYRASGKRLERWVKAARSSKSLWSLS